MNARALALPLPATTRKIFLCSGLLVEVLLSFVAGMTVLRNCVRQDDFVWRGAERMFRVCPPLCHVFSVFGLRFARGPSKAGIVCFRCDLPFILVIQPYCFTSQASHTHRGDYSDERVK